MISFTYLDEENKPFILKFLDSHIQVITSGVLYVSPGYSFILTAIGIKPSKGVVLSTYTTATHNNMLYHIIPTLLNKKQELELLLYNPTQSKIIVSAGIVIADMVAMVTDGYGSMERYYYPADQWQ